MPTQQDIVIEHIHKLVESGMLNSGDRLPAERRLAEKLGVSRANVRAAYQKLEVYGVAKTYPQSGTVIKDFNHKVLTAQMAGILKLDRYDFKSLVHVRSILELEAVKLAAKNATAEDIEEIRKACEATCQCGDTDERNEKDFEFHQAIARASHNPVIASLLLVITPDVLHYFHLHHFCWGKVDQSNEDHRMLCDAIAAGNAGDASRIIKSHLRDLVAFSKKNKAD